MARADVTPATIPDDAVAASPHVTVQSPPRTERADVFGQVRWQHLPGAERLLDEVSANTWANPADQDWQRIKHNARREVWRAEITGEALYLKYHFPERGFRGLRELFRPSPCRLEWESGLYATHAGIPAVEPIAATSNLQRDGRPCGLLITRAVEPAEPLSDFWRRLVTDANRTRLRQDKAQVIELLAEMIARSHQAGLEHLDMHAANILVQRTAPRQYRTVFVDLQSARRDVPITDHAVVRNLAQLNQWFRRHSTIGDRLRFLRAYLRWRNEFEAMYEHGRALELSYDALVRALVTAAGRHAERLWAQRDRRATRNGRYFTRLRVNGWRGVAMTRCKHVHAESPVTRLHCPRSWWREQLVAPLDLLTPARADTCKDSHSAAVAQVKLPHLDGAIEAIVKRPRARNGWRRLVQMFPPSRSARGWTLGNALLHRDTPAARPLACLERRLGPLVLDSVLLTEAVPGAVDLDTFLRRVYAESDRRTWAQTKRELALQLVRLVRLLEERGFDHRDCKASNVLVVQEPVLKLIWIDMDGLRRKRLRTRAAQLRPLARLHVSLLDVPGLTRTDRLRFLKRWAAHFGSDHRTWRRDWSNLAAASAKKIRAKAARTEWKRRKYGRS